MPMRSLSFTDIKDMVKKRSLSFLKLTVELYMQTCQWAPNSGKNSEIQVDFWPKFYILAKQNAKNGQFARILDFATCGSGYVQILLIWILWPKSGLKYEKKSLKMGWFSSKNKNLHFFGLAALHFVYNSKYWFPVIFVVEIVHFCLHFFFNFAFVKLNFSWARLKLLNMECFLLFFCPF